MLVLTRRVGEQILIARGQIQIKVLSENNGVVVLGVLAPDFIDIDRKEVYLRKISNERRPKLAETINEKESVI